jgi:hypothetical protein
MRAAVPFLALGLVLATPGCFEMFDPQSIADIVSFRIEGAFDDGGASPEYRSNLSMDVDGGTLWLGNTTTPGGPVHELVPPSVNTSIRIRPVDAQAAARFEIKYTLHRIQSDVSTQPGSSTVVFRTVPMANMTVRGAAEVLFPINGIGWYVVSALAKRGEFGFKGVDSLEVAINTHWKAHGTVHPLGYSHTLVSTPEYDARADRFSFRLTNPGASTMVEVKTSFRGTGQLGEGHRADLEVRDPRDKPVCHTASPLQTSGAQATTHVVTGKQILPGTYTVRVGTVSSQCSGVPAYTNAGPVPYTLSVTIRYLD